MSAHKKTPVIGTEAAPTAPENKPLYKNPPPLVFHQNVRKSEEMTHRRDTLLRPGLTFPVLAIAPWKKSHGIVQTVGLLREGMQDFIFFKDTETAPSDLEKWTYDDEFGFYWPPEVKDAFYAKFISRALADC